MATSKAAAAAKEKLSRFYPKRFLHLVRGRPLLQMTLFAIFLAFFGLPAIERYQAKQVMVVKIRRDTGGIEAPTISIAAWNPQTKNGWRGNTSMTYDLTEANCKDYNRSRSVDQCIEERTYKKEEIIKDVILGYTVKKSLLEQQDIFTEDFSTAWDGMHYSLDLSKRIGPDDSADQLFILLDKKLTYSIALHDPRYFVVNTNPAGLPNVILRLDPGMDENNYYRLALTEVVHMDLPNDPCQAEGEYNFQACVKQALSNKVGCRTKWDRWSSEDVPVCTDLEQFMYVFITQNFIDFNLFT